MSIAAAAPAAVDLAPGTGELAFTRAGAKTVVRRALAVSPLKFLQPNNRGPAAWIYTSSYGGGLVRGDQIRLRIEVDAGSAAYVTTQASTKVYRTAVAPGQPPNISEALGSGVALNRSAASGSGQHVTATIAEDGVLIMLPDPVVCFSGSRYQQEQEYLLQPGAALVLVDWFTSGRRAFGERWAFHGYRSRIRIWHADRLILHDSLTLDPDDGPLAERFEQFNVVAMAAIVGERFSEEGQGIAAAVAASPLMRRPAYHESCSPLPCATGLGVLLRITGTDVEQVGRVLHERLQFLAGWLGDDPWARKMCYPL